MENGQFFSDAIADKSHHYCSNLNQSFCENLSTLKEKQNEKYKQQ